MEKEIRNPPALNKPIGYAHSARIIGAQKVLLLGGITALNPDGVIEDPGDLVAQFDKALANIVTALAYSGAKPTDVMRVRIYCPDLAVYRSKWRELGQLWKKHFGKHYPAMALLGVKELIDEGAMVEIECEAYPD